MPDEARSATRGLPLDKRVSHVGRHVLCSHQISVCSEISRASSTSIPRYLTVDSSLCPAVHRLETTSIYTHVATAVLREVVSPLDVLPTP